MSESKCPYSDQGMERLRDAILSQAYIDFKEANRKSKCCYIHASQLKRKKDIIHHQEEGQKFAREMVRILVFVKSEWFRILTEFKSPQKEILKELMRQVNPYLKDYVKREYKNYLYLKGEKDE